MKKNYVSPSIKTEMIEIGVFGCYGGTGDDRGRDNRHGGHDRGHGRGHGRFFGFF